MGTIWFLIRETDFKRPHESAGTISLLHGGSNQEEGK